MRKVSIGIPAHLAETVTARANVVAQHAVAFVGILAMMIALLVLQGSHIDLLIWPLAIVQLPGIAALWWMHSSPSFYSHAVYLLVTGIGLFLVVFVFAGSIRDEYLAAGFSTMTLRLAMVLVGSPWLSNRSSFAWTAAGYCLSEFAVYAGTALQGVPHVFNPWVLVATVIVMLAVPTVRFVSAPSRRAQPVFARAADDEARARLRIEMEERAAALVHDTVLGNLAAIEKLETDSLPDALRAGIENDLGLLQGERWLRDGADDAIAEGHRGWRDSELHAAVQQARLMGLKVSTSGDRAATALLSRREDTAVALAVKQCLVNVQRHSGTDEAEVVIFASDDEFSVMVVDGGKGFVTDGESDRLGLRLSVRRRVEQLGGRAQVWSTPGRGTTVMIVLPLRTETDDEDLLEPAEVGS